MDVAIQLSSSPKETFMRRDLTCARPSTGSDEQHASAAVLSRSSGPRTSIAALAATACMAMLSGCAVHTFDVQPRIICSGDTVTVHWDASGHVRLVQAGTASPVDANGSQSQRLTADRTYQLQVLGDAGNVTELSMPITVRVAPDAYPIALAPVCDERDAVIRWESTQRPDDFDRLVFARQLTNESPRAARFQKGGQISELLAPGETGGAMLTGAHVSGQWRAFAMTQPNERCSRQELPTSTGPSLPRPTGVDAPTMRVRVLVGCGRSQTGTGDGPGGPDVPDKPDKPDRPHS